MNFKSYLKNSIFRTFLFSYIVLILFYTVFSFPAIYYNNKKISSQIYKQNKLLLKESATKIENGLGSLPSIASSVLYNSEFSALLSSFSDGQIDYSKSYSVIAFLISVQNSVYAGTKTAVYFKNQDTIISSEGIYTAKNFYDGVYSFKNDSYDEWFKYLNDSKENYYILRDSSKEKKDRYLFYSCSKPKKKQCYRLYLYTVRIFSKYY